MQRKPVILVFADWFVPGYKAGGPISSCFNFALLMKEDYDVYVFTSDTDHGETEPYRDIPSNQWINNIDPGFKVYYARRKEISFRQVREVLQEIQPDFVYLNNMYSVYYVLYPLVLKWRGVLKAEIVLCPRGALYESALAVKPLKKKFFIRAFKLAGIHRKFLFQATNLREKAAINNIFPGSQVKVVDDLPSIRQPEWETVEKEKGSLKCIFIARIVAIKNLLFLLQVLEHVKSKVELTITGPAEDAAYWEQCQEKIKQLPAQIQVNYTGPRPNHLLIQAVREHHLYILPTEGESFGHTIFESLSAGRPVLISDQTPWHGLPGKKIGWDISLQNREEFVRAIEEAAGWGQDSFNEWAANAYEYAHQYIQNSGFKEQYSTLFS